MGFLSFLRGSGMSCGKSSGGMVEVEEDEGTFGALDFSFFLVKFRAIVSMGKHGS